MIAVHKQRLRKACSTVNRIHNEHKIRQTGLYKLVDIRFPLGEHIQQQRRAGDKKCADKRNLFCRTPKDPAMPFDKQVV